MNTEDYQAAIDQMAYEIVDSGPIEMPASTPATFAFVDQATYAPDEFEAELEDQDFSVFTATTEEREDGAFYYYVDVMTDHYKKVHVRLWQETACVFPKDELPDKYEVGRIIGAIEESFGELNHDPTEE